MENSDGALIALDQRFETYRQANALARAAQQLALAEKRLLVLALSQIDYRAERPSLETIVPLSALIEHGVANPYNRARSAALSLARRVVVLNYDDGAFTAFPWVQLVEYRPSNETPLGYSHVRVVFNEELRPYVAALRGHYAVLPLAAALALPSVFAARLFELLWHQSHGGKRGVEIELLELKFALGLIERNTRQNTWVRERYTQWKDFKKQLNGALDTIAAATPLSAEFEGIRVGRKIGRIRFTVIIRKAHPAPTPDLDAQQPTDHAELIARAQQLGFVGDVGRWVEQYGVEVVGAAVGITEREAARGALRSPGGFLRSVLTNGAAKREAEAVRVARPVAAVEPVVDTRQLEREWSEYRRDVADVVAADVGLDQAALVELVREHVSSLGAAARVVRQSLDADGWEGTTFRVYATEVVLERWSDRAPVAALDFEVFCRERKIS